VAETILQRDKMGKNDRLLLLDTVGTAPGAVLVEGTRVLAAAEFPLRSASAVLLGDMRRMLGSAGYSLRDLDGIGVVSGPGSFTGVRTGLAAAKGLCEAAGLPLAAVSRLAVLAHAAGLKHGFAVLNAGRGSVYVREVAQDGQAREYLASIIDVKARADGARVVIAEEALAEELGGLAPTLRGLKAIDLLAPVLRCLAEGGSDLVWTDANYVQSESEIYHTPHAAARKSAPIR
jgi:tRNA threonylcarbamoyladenosine biosynthesis protein TsaB